MGNQISGLEILNNFMDNFLGKKINVELMNEKKVNRKIGIIK
jgi:hypothetical protein